MCGLVTRRERTCGGGGGVWTARRGRGVMPLVAAAVQGWRFLTGCISTEDCAVRVRVAAGASPATPTSCSLIRSSFTSSPRSWVRLVTLGDCLSPSGGFDSRQDRCWACLLAEGCCLRTAATGVRIPAGPQHGLTRGQRSGDLAVLTKLPRRVRSSRPRRQVPCPRARTRPGFPKPGEVVRFHPVARRGSLLRPRARMRPGSTKPGEVVRFHPVAPATTRARRRRRRAARRA